MRVVAAGATLTAWLPVLSPFDRSCSTARTSVQWRSSTGSCSASKGDREASSDDRDKLTEDDEDDEPDRDEQVPD